MIADDIRLLDSRSHAYIEKGMTSDVFKKTFITEFPLRPESPRLDSSSSLHNSSGETILSILKCNVPPRIRSFCENIIGFMRDLPSKISVWAKLIQRSPPPLVINPSPTPQKISAPPKTTAKVTKIGAPSPVVVDGVEEEAEEKDENVFKSRNIAAFLAD